MRLREEETERLFGAWRMGLLRVDAARAAEIDGLSAFLHGRPAKTETADADARVLKILDPFRSGRWRREVDDGPAAP